MTIALFRLALRDGTTAFARGEVEHGPNELLAPDVSLTGMLAAGADAFADTLRSAPSAGAVPQDAHPIAPVDLQEIWAAGVTYERSRVARMDESADPSVYDRVYEAARPELFFKAPAWRVRGPGESIGIRTDSEWDVPEPELALVVTADLGICGFTIANDVSSRTIEGENPLYLPQAKIYDGSCAIGPAIVPAASVDLPLAIRLLVIRDGAPLVDASTSTERLRRSPEELAGYLGRALTLPHGAILLTGTGIVPGEGFSLREGDVVRIEIERLGALENPVVSVGDGATPGQSATVAVRRA